MSNITAGNTYKVVVFDLDDTLAKIGKSIPNSIVEQIRRLENQGIQIVVCSGKPTFYLCGLMRQVGLERPILIGENGIVIQWGVELPPKREIIIGYTKEETEFIEEVRNDIKREMLAKIWLQPNVVALGMFIKDEKYREDIRNYLLDKLKTAPSTIQLLEHADAFDLTTKINKGTGLRKLFEILGVKQEETVSVGDAANDYPMFRETGVSIGISLKEKEKARYSVGSIDEAMQLIFNLL